VKYLAFDCREAMEFVLENYPLKELVVVVSSMLSNVV
jgi:hypothetical protein